VQQLWGMTGKGMKDFNNTSKSPLPQNIEAEQAVLGAILTRGELLVQVLSILTKEDFYREVHMKIFDAMVSMQGEGKPIDVLTISQYMKSNGNMEHEGASSYICYLTEIVPTTANALYYARLVKEKSFDRAICLVSMELMDSLCNGSISNTQAIERMNKAIENISSRSLGDDSGVISSKDLLKQEAESIEWYVEGLIPKSSVILITAPPGLMKTWLAMYIGLCIATGESCLGRDSRKATVYYIDKENPRRLIIHRLNRLGTDEDFKIWGRWMDIDPPNLDEGLMTYKRLAKDNTVVIFDSLIRFHSGEENSSTDMSRVLSNLRHLTKKGATEIVLHHKGKSEHEYRGSSDILAGVDICYTLTKTGESLQLSCEAKNRFSQPFTLHLQIDEGSEYFRFVEVSSPRQRGDETGFQQVTDVIKELVSKGEEPYQGKIIKSAKEGYGLSKDKVLKWLDKGEGMFWKVVKGLHNRKIYALIDEQQESDETDATTPKEDSVYQFADAIPPGKQENRKTNIDP